MKRRRREGRCNTTASFDCNANCCNQQPYLYSAFANSCPLQTEYVAALGPKGNQYWSILSNGTLIKRSHLCILISWKCNWSTNPSTESIIWWSSGPMPVAVCSFMRFINCFSRERQHHKRALNNQNASSHLYQSGLEKADVAVPT